MEFLDLDEVEFLVAREVLQTAEDIQHERNKAQIKAWEVAVQNGVAKAFK